MSTFMTVALLCVSDKFKVAYLADGGNFH